MTNVGSGLICSAESGLFKGLLTHCKGKRARRRNITQGIAFHQGKEHVQ